MSGVLPPNRLDQIQFCEAHLPVWTAAPAASIGLTTAQITALANLTGDARKDYDAAISARDAAKAATLQFHNSTRAMRDKAAELIRVIKTFADTSNNPNVFVLAQIPAPAAPSPNPPPGQPGDVVIGLDSSGAITLRWRSENATGGFFQVQRRLNSGGTPGGTSPFVTIGGSGSREFTDNTLPLGAMGATYIITGYRGTTPGTPSNQVTVQFGVTSSGGGMTVTGGTLQMAA